MSIYQEGLAPAAVNHMALSPLSFIERPAAVYPNSPAVIHGSLRRNWQETYQRCRRLASALHGRGTRQGDTVAAMLPNIPAMLECHFGVPMIGAVLNTLNVRLDSEAIAFMLDHGEARVLITDREFHDVIREALELIKRPILVVDVDDPEYGEGEALSDLDYEAFLAEGDPEFEWHWPDDEWQAITLNYTSGTTGNPKGALYSHRSTVLHSMAVALPDSLDLSARDCLMPVVPMFHVNAWGIPYAAAMVGSKMVLPGPGLDGDSLKN